MTTLESYVSRIISILNQFKTQNDSRIAPKFIADRIADYRATEIARKYKQYGIIDQQVIQDFGTIKPTLVANADDPFIPFVNRSIGKIIKPNIIELPGGAGYYNISNPSKTSMYGYTDDINTFFNTPRDFYFNGECMFLPIGEALYINPYLPAINMMAVLVNPLEGYVLKTTHIESGDLIYETSYDKAETYLVDSGTIVHNGNSYNTGQTFTAVNSVFTGNGKIKLATQKRKLRSTDNYPISGEMFDVIFTRILVEDFKIEKQQAANIITNSQDDRVQEN